MTIISVSVPGLFSYWPQLPSPTCRVCRETRPAKAAVGWGCWPGSSWSASSARSWCRGECRWCEARGRAGWCRYCRLSEISRRIKICCIHSQRRLLALKKHSIFEPNFAEIIIISYINILKTSNRWEWHRFQCWDFQLN